MDWLTFISKIAWPVAIVILPLVLAWSMPRIGREVRVRGHNFGVEIGRADKPRPRRRMVTKSESVKQIESKRPVEE